MTITHGILRNFAYKNMLDECLQIQQLDLFNGYVTPAPIFRSYKKIYHPPKEDPGRAPMTGRGGAVVKKRLR